MTSRILQEGKRLFFFLAFLMLWEYAGRKGLINKFLLPAPSVIVNTEILKDKVLLSHVGASLQRVIVGFLISSILGIGQGFILGLNKRLRFYLMPFISLIRPIPPIAWIPITILWFGLGNGPSYFITMVASFFPIFFNTLAGVEDIDPHYLNVARCFGAGEKQIFKDVIFPYSLPYIFSGLRTGLGVAWMSVIASEIVSASSGLGYMIEISQQMVRIDNVIVGMIVIGICGLILDKCILQLRYRMIGWKQ